MLLGHITRVSERDDAKYLNSLENDAFLLSENAWFGGQNLRRSLFHLGIYDSISVCHRCIWWSPVIGDIFLLQAGNSNVVFAGVQFAFGILPDSSHLNVIELSWKAVKAAKSNKMIIKKKKSRQQIYTAWPRL